MPSFKYDDKPRKPYEEPGEYLCTVEVAEWTMSKGSGNSMIKLQLRTSGGALVFDNLVFTEKAFWKVSAAFAAFFPSKGVPAPKEGDNIDYEERQDWLDEHLVGANGWAILIKGTSTSGKTRNEVETYLLPKKGTPAASSVVSGTAQVSNKPAPPATSASATPKRKFPAPDEDEIPF